jgi:hypothetical protein
MKKIIIILVLFFNINVVDNSNCINVTIGNISVAQSGYGGPNPCDGGSGGTGFQWWNSFTSWLTSASTWAWLGELFNGSGGGGSSINQYPNFGGSIYPAGYFNQYNTAGGGGGGGSVPPAATDCQTVYGGTLDICGACVGGSTLAVACDASVIADTLKPEKYPCPVDAVARDLKSDTIFNFIKDSAITKNAIDSAPFRNFEVGFTIRQYAQPNCNTCYTYRPGSYNIAGATQNVTWTNSINSIADAHTHTAKSDSGEVINESPSARDYYGLMTNTVDPYFIRGYRRKFIFSGDSARAIYATVAEDTAKITMFLANNPLDSVIQTNPNLPNVNNWRGDSTKPTSFFNRFEKAVSRFRKEGYPERLLNTYANVYILDQLNLGIKLQTLVNGSFKELKFEKAIDPITGVEHYKIKICE